MLHRKGGTGLRHEQLQLQLQHHAGDEASAVEAAGLAPRLVSSDSTNLKVTYPGDLALAELILAARTKEADS